MSDIIQQIRDAYAENHAKALKLLPELFQAADEGKIVVLPCKVKTKIWCIYSTINNKNPYILSDKFDYSMIPCFGKLYF